MEEPKGGFPHSEICGSKGARASPHLIAACHVLHRLSMPRHPSEALKRLIVLTKAAGKARLPIPRRPYGPSQAWSWTVDAISRSQTPSGIRQTMSSYRSPLKAACAAGLTLPSQCHLTTALSGCENLFPRSRTRPAASVSPGAAWRLVEPDGFEPTTSCLQSTRSTD